jgi:hypothetical protein
VQQTVRHAGAAAGIAQGMAPLSYRHAVAPKNLDIIGRPSRETAVKNLPKRRRDR